MSELLKINVNDHVEKKGQLSYLSWAWAWAEVLKIDSGAVWKAHEWNGQPAMFLPNGTAMVKVSVTIKGDTKECPLPVMDHKNKAIVNPDAFAVNTATMRALAKAVGMHGLGLYIYAGEDLPEAPAPQLLTDEQVTEITTLLEGRDFAGFMKWVSKCVGQELKALKDVPAEAYNPIIKKLTEKKETA